MPEGDQPVDEPTGSGTGDNGAPSAPPASTFTQADLDRINAETRRKAEEKAYAKFASELGVESIDQAKAIVAAQKAAEDAAKTELQRAQDELARVNARADQAEARAQEMVIRSRLENAFRDAGINPGRVDGALRLAPLGDVKLTDDGSVVGVEDAVKAVKEASPEWFGAPGKPFAAPDASGSGDPVEVDYRTASTEQVNAYLKSLGVKPVSHSLSF